MNSKNALRRTCLAATAVLLVAACIAALEKDKFPYATIGESCDPSDGPAIDLDFSSTPLKCGKGDTVELTVSFWRELPLHDGQTFSLDANSRWGGASYCKGGERMTCELATSGSIHIESFTHGKGAKGTYELVFPKLGRVIGSFHADWCRRIQYCR